mmetsp:Transcript_47552/g.78700  ORF Transcript_47552/g.78700 Transcript_47552/m.78700 type:complete len:301 (+) Transcript_47552:1031-1933(+)
MHVMSDERIVEICPDELDTWRGENALRLRRKRVDLPQRILVFRGNVYLRGCVGVETHKGLSGVTRFEQLGEAHGKAKRVLIKWNPLVIEHLAELGAQLVRDVAERFCHPLSRSVWIGVATDERGKPIVDYRLRLFIAKQRLGIKDLRLPKNVARVTGVLYRSLFHMCCAIAVDARVSPAERDGELSLPVLGCTHLDEPLKADVWVDDDGPVPWQQPLVVERRCVGEGFDVVLHLIDDTSRNSERDPPRHVRVHADSHPCRTVNPLGVPLGLHSRGKPEGLQTDHVHPRCTVVNIPHVYRQ